MKIKNENEKVKSIGILLAKHPEDNILGTYLQIDKLDFSLESLKFVDRYLEKIKEKKKKLTEEETKKLILRCGTYLGEVIRKCSQKRFIWISYETAVKLQKDISKLERSLLTHILLYDLEGENFAFPLNKVYKFLEHGKSENLWSFAMVILEKSKEVKS